MSPANRFLPSCKTMVPVPGCIPALTESIEKVRQPGFWTQCLNLLGTYSAPGVGDWHKQIAFVSPIL